MTGHRTDPAAEQERAHSRWRIPRLIGLGILAVWLAGVIAIGAFVLALAMGWQRDQVRTTLALLASELLDREIYIGRLDGTLFGGFELGEISVRPPPSSESPATAFRIEVLRVEVELIRSLRSLQPVLRRVEVVGAEIGLSRHAGAEWELDGWGGLPEASEAPAAPPPTRRGVVILETLVLRDARFALRSDAESGLENVRARLDAQFNGLRWMTDAPPPWPKTGDARLDLDSIGWRGNLLGSGSASWAFQGRRARLESLGLSGPLGSFRATGSVAFRGAPTDARLAGANTSISFEAVDLGQLRANTAAQSDPLTALAGDLHARLIFEIDPGPGGGRHPTLSLHAALGPSKIAGEPLRRGSFDARYRLAQGDWFLDDSELELEPGVVNARGEGDRSERMRFELDAPALELSRVPRRWLPLEAAGEVSVELRLAGAWSDPTGELSIVGTQLDVEGVGRGALDLRASALGAGSYRIETFTWQTGKRVGAGPFWLRVERPARIAIADARVEVEDLALAWPGGSAEITGGFAEDALLPTRIALRALDLSIATALVDAAPPLSGDVSGRIAMSGPLGAPLVSTRLAWTDPAYLDARAERLDIALDADAERIELVAELAHDGHEPLRVSLGVPRMRDTLEAAALLTHPTSRLDARLRGLDLELVALLLTALDRDPSSTWASRSTSWPRPSGNIDGDLRLTGAASGPLIEGTLTLIGVGLTDPRRDDASGVAGMKVGPIDGELLFSGERLDISGLRLGSNGEACTLSAGIAWPRVEGVGAEDGEADASRGLDWTLGIEGVGFNGRLDSQGSIRAGRIERAALRLVGFDASRLASWAGLGLPFGGTVSGNAEASGAVDAPEVRLGADWDHPLIANASADTLRLDARLGADRLEAEAKVTRDEVAFLIARARLPIDRAAGANSLGRVAESWATDPASQLTVQADAMQLDWLPVVVPDLPLRTGGAITGQVEVVGGTPIPLLTGSVAIDRGVFALLGQHASLGPLSGYLIFEGAEARIENLELESRRGRARFGGSIKWSEAGFEEVALEVIFERYLFSQLGMLRAFLDGRVLATGPVDALHVSGDIELTDVRVSFPSAEDPILTEIRVRGLPSSRDPSSIEEGRAEIAGIGEQSSVDVRLILPPGAWVRGIGLNAEILGEVHVSKAPGAQPRYRGQLAVEHGRYTLQGRGFELERGLAMFSGDEGPIPELDVIAHRQAARDVRVTAHLTGPANAPRLELTSEPPMDSAEIISYVFFGQPSSGAAGGATEGLQETAAGVAGMMLVDGLAPDLREQLRIDEISVTSGSDDEPPAVEIETQITQDVYLRLIQSLGASADEAVEVRWRFWKGLSMRSRVARSGASAIDLLWEFDYWGLDRFGLGGLNEPPPPFERTPAPPAAESDGAEAACRPPMRCEP